MQIGLIKSRFSFTGYPTASLADPRIVNDPVSTYKELHELARMGACVLHEDAIYPVKEAGIPINIRNTNSPEDFGTLVTKHVGQQPNHEITGIAGKKGYCTLRIQKPGFDSIGEFENRVLTILQKGKILPQYRIRNCRYRQKTVAIASSINWIFADNVVYYS